MSLFQQLYSVLVDPKVLMTMRIVLTDDNCFVPPLCLLCTRHDKICISLANDFLYGGDQLIARISSPPSDDAEPDMIFRSERVPTLIMHSSDDPVTDVEYSRSIRDVLTKHAKAPVNYVEFEKAYHEIFNESDELGCKLYFETAAQFLQEAFSQATAGY